jgi:PAS domain S-box-containing protein
MNEQEKTREELIKELNDLQLEYNSLKLLYEAESQEHKRSAAFIRESENKFKKIYEKGPFGMVMADSMTKFIAANDTFCQMIGYTEAELQNYTIKDITYPDDINTDVRNIQHLMEGIIPIYKTEKRYVRKDGVMIWGALTVTANYNEDGQFLYNLAIIEDITGRKYVEAALAKVTERLELATSSANIGIWDWDIPSDRISWDEQMYKLYGFYQGPFPEVYKAWQKGLHPDDRETANDFTQQALRGERECDTEFRVVWADKSIHWLKAVGKVFFDENHNPVRMVGVNYDISERKQAEVALRKSEDLFNKAFHGSPSPMTIATQSDGTYIAVNNSFLRLVNLSRDEVIGKKGHELGLIDAEERAKLRRELQEKGTMHNIEVIAKSTSGQQLHLLTSIENTELAGEACTIVTMLDITERKQAELLLQEKSEEIEAQNEEYQQLNEELQQTNEELLEAKERAEQSDQLKTAFLQNMSHEIRTPMNAIMGFSELLTEQYNNKTKLEQFAKIINQRSSDLLEIINGVLDVAKIESGQVNINLEECRLLSLFAELSIFFKEYRKKQGKQHIEFSIQSNCDIPDEMIRTDKVKLKQILINLIGNAFKFTDKGEIHAGCSLDANHHILFYVSDTGIGIPYNKHDFIFERFARLEPKPDHLYGGTGLGLSIVKGLIDLLGGKIWLESEPGKGTTFYFSFPYERVSPLPQESLEAENTEKYNFSNKTILIVEDDVYNADYLSEILNGTGFEITRVSTGKEAIEISKSQKLDIILMDIRLPDMDGYTAINIIRKYKPDLKIIAQTAYASLDDKEKAINAGCNDYISKPIGRKALLSMIKEHLEE